LSGQDPRTSRLGSKPRTVKPSILCLSVHGSYHQCHTVLTSPKGPKVKRCRCPVLAGPDGRRQSRRCRSVHRPRAETSIWYSPVHGTRAPTEHPTRHHRLCMSLVDALTESQGRPEPLSRNTGSRHRRSAPTACRLTSANNVREHPPITHRQLTVPGRPCCLRHAMPVGWRARILGQRHTPSRPAAATFRWR
jgi:hypothetical protein